MEIILVHPEIAENVGNIVRTCAVTGSKLVLVPPLGFSISSRRLKRAGLDYWLGVDVMVVEDIIRYLENRSSFYFFSSKASKSYSSVDYTIADALVFGSESKGLPQHFLARWNERFVRIPMKEGARCLNLSNTVAIALYHAYNHIGFPGMV